MSPIVKLCIAMFDVGSYPLRKKPVEPKYVPSGIGFPAASLAVIVYLTAVAASYEDASVAVTTDAITAAETFTTAVAVIRPVAASEKVRVVEPSATGVIVATYALIGEPW